MGFCLPLLWILFLIPSASAAAFRTHYCGLNTSIYTPNSTYNTNLIQVFHSLYQDTTVSEERFLTKNQGNSPPDRVYGLFLCRADILENDCGNCLLKVIEDVNKTCPSQKEAVFWMDECMLHYASHSIASLMDASNFACECNKINVTDQIWEQAQFWEVARNLMDRLAGSARSDSEKRYAFGELSYDDTRMVYGYVQCTPDLSGSECGRCLQASIDRLPQHCYGRQGARILTPSCNVRYEIYKFLNFEVTSSGSPGKKISAKIIAAIVTALGSSLVILSLCLLFIRKKQKQVTIRELKNETDESEIITEQSLQFELATIKAATNDFSIHNKIGEGGFGEVFKGVLPDERQVAVKRLSKGSRQGTLEFKNEVLLLAKLQHINLVRLLGFCLEAEERILVYEYVPNHSLDYFLFDPTKQAQLDWPIRYKLIGRIARGMLYLHEDSRLKIIHRDLKASNILLDEDMNPKISDFGLARIFDGNQTQANTTRIVGTVGYMSPEYAMHGNFSIKSDVFSFGVLILEIISGKRNTRDFRYGRTEDLLSNAWKKWKDREPLKIMDLNLVNSNLSNEVLHCIHIGLLCVQEDEDLRPSMAAVVLMLNSYSMALPLPQNPPFIFNNKGKYMTSKVPELESSICQSSSWPTDGSPITEIQPR